MSGFTLQIMLGKLLAVIMQLTKYYDCFYNKADAYGNHTFKFMVVGIIMCVSCILVIEYVHNFTNSKMF